MGIDGKEKTGRPRKAPEDLGEAIAWYIAIFGNNFKIVQLKEFLNSIYNNFDLSNNAIRMYVKDCGLTKHK